jgi:copper oxidase (laccase) domain-containing protein
MVFENLKIRFLRFSTIPAFVTTTDAGDFLPMQVGSELSQRNKKFIDQVCNLTNAGIIGMNLDHKGAIRPTQELNAKQLHNQFWRSQEPADAVYIYREYDCTPPINIISYSADCGAILIYDSNLLAVIHMSWRTFITNIISNVIEQICNKYNLSPNNLKVGIFSGIRSCCFEIKDDNTGNMLKIGFNKLVPIERFWNTVYFLGKNSNMYIDLLRAYIVQLMFNEIKSSNIEIIDACSKCSDNLFSVRGGDKGRNAIVARTLW